MSCRGSPRSCRCGWQQRKVFGKLHSIRLGLDCLRGSAGFGSRFGVEGVDVGHAARHIEVDDVLGLWGMVEWSVQSKSCPEGPFRHCPGNMLTPRKLLAAKLMNLRLSSSPAVLSVVFMMIFELRSSYWTNEN